ncbi:helix-turn-helix domain-containing protein [Ralstonia sp. L16]|uniref:helix-turn-helix domain-containing protein n=1 Tax=Ralstonia sp. L16 TaxID=3423950 RepID=UPI003F79ABF4
MDSKKLQFADRLARERVRLGLSQLEMAGLGGVALRTYANYESGDREPGVSALANWGKHGADVLYLVTGKHVPALLSAEEDAVVSSFRELDMRGRAGVLGLLAGMQSSAAGVHVRGDVGQYFEGDQTGVVNIDMSKGRKKAPR